MSAVRRHAANPKEQDNRSARGVRILIADDHAVVRKGLRQIISDAFPEAEFGEATNANDTLELVWKQDWDVVILDIAMPGRNGLEVLNQLKNEKSRAAVLVLSVHPEDQFALPAMRAGAAGFITKESAAEMIVVALQKILSGGRYFSEAVLAKMTDVFSQGASAAAPHELLSDRELQVLQMLGSGKTVKEIGVELCLSMKTVSTYRVRILRKLNLQNNVEIARYALRNHLVQ